MADKKKPEPAKEPEPQEVQDDPTPGDIDARMAALLKDHQRMGARPK